MRKSVFLVLIMTGLCTFLYPETVRVGTTTNPPLVFSREDGTAGGLFIEILKYAAAKEGWHLEYKNGSLNECLAWVLSGEIDIIADLGYSVERAKKYGYSKKCVISTWAQVYTAKGVTVSSLLDIAGKRVVVEKDDYFVMDPEHGFRSMAAQLGIECEFIEVLEYDNVFEYLDQGKADAGIVNRIFGDTEEHKYSIDKTSIIFSPVSLRYAYRRGDERGMRLCSVIDSHLDGLKADPDSVYYEFLKKISIDKPHPLIPLWLIYSFIAAVVGLGIFGGLSWALNVKVKARTRELEEANERTSHLNAVLRAIRNVNQLITRERDRDILIQESCDKLIENRGYGFAWIGLFDEKHKCVKAVQAGLNDVFDALYARFKEGPLPECCALALETPEIVVVTDDIRTKCNECPLASKCIGKTELAIRLDYHGQVYGVLSLSLPEEFKDQEEELSLFEEAAGDIAFALHSIRVKEDHDKAQKDLEISSVQWQTTFDAMADPVFVLDNEQHIMRCNHVVSELFGKNPDEIVGTHCWETVHYTSEAIEECPHLRMMKSQQRETQIVSVGDKTYEVTVDPLQGNNGDVIGSVHIMKDISEQKALQQQLLQSQKMEAIGNLAGGVAHDFNNILTVIKGNTELGLMKLDKENSLYPDMTQVKEAADRAANLTRQLLLYGRRQPMDFTHLDMDETIQNLLKMLKRLIGEDIEVQTDFEEPVWPVKADPGNIEQVIMNISVNARDAMPDGGTLTYSTKNIKIDDAYVGMYTYARTGRFVCLSVEDTGTGMDKETREHIFEPFFTTKGVGEGTGLGMSVVYGIIKEHEGWINIYSEPGKGTTFKVYLPASFTREKPKPITKDIEKQARGKGEKILLVEDEETVLVTTRKILEEMGYSITVAATAEEAVEIFDREKGSFDLLFTDTILPDTNGIELIDQLTEKKPDLKVLLSSGYAGEKVQRDIIQERRYPFVQKPYDMTELLALINQILTEEIQS